MRLKRRETNKRLKQSQEAPLRAEPVEGLISTKRRGCFWSKKRLNVAVVRVTNK